MSDIDNLRAKVLALQDQLSAALKSLGAAEIGAAGISVGKVVRSTKNGKLYRVSKIEPKIWTVWIKGNPQRKNGSYGTAEHNLLGNWEGLP